MAKITMKSILKAKTSAAVKARADIKAKAEHERQVQIAHGGSGAMQFALLKALG